MAMINYDHLPPYDMENNTKFNEYLQFISYKSEQSIDPIFVYKKTLTLFSALFSSTLSQSNDVCVIVFLCSKTKN